MIVDGTIIYWSIGTALKCRCTCLEAVNITWEKYKGRIVFSRINIRSEKSQMLIQIIYTMMGNWLSICWNDDLDKINVKPGWTPLKIVHRSVTVIATNCSANRYYTIWSIVEILNQSRSIAKELVECMPSCLGQSRISAIRENCDGTSCVCEASIRPIAISVPVCKHGKGTGCIR